MKGSEQALLQFTEKGLWCKQANVYLDPWQPVRYALITHAHSDHAKPGMGQYLTHYDNIPILKKRLGEHIVVQGTSYGQSHHINGVEFTFYPAGHIIGSAQIKVEYKGEIWVFTGDYKLTPDPLLEPWQPVKCHTLITECTFGLPVFQFPDRTSVFEEIHHWWAQNQQEGKASLLMGYALGKAQSLLAGLQATQGPVLVHGAVHAINECIPTFNKKLATYQLLSDVNDKEVLKRALIVAPPAALASPWVKKLGNFNAAMASGWMQLRGLKKRRGVEKGFVFSDHCDWNELLQAIDLCSPERVITTHGYTEVFARFLNETHNLKAEIAKTNFGEEETLTD